MSNYSRRHCGFVKYRERRKFVVLFTGHILNPKTYEGIWIKVTLPCFQVCVSLFMWGFLANERVTLKTSALESLYSGHIHTINSVDKTKLSYGNLGEFSLHCFALNVSFHRGQKPAFNSKWKYEKSARRSRCPKYAELISRFLQGTAKKCTRIYNTRAHVHSHCFAN